MAIGSTAWTNRQTGKSFDTPKVDLVRFHDGQIVEFFELYDTDQVMATSDPDGPTREILRDFPRWTGPKAGDQASDTCKRFKKSTQPGMKLRALTPTSGWNYLPTMWKCAHSLMVRRGSSSPRTTDRRKRPPSTLLGWPQIGRYCIIVSMIPSLNYPTRWAHSRPPIEMTRPG